MNMLQKVLYFFLLPIIAVLSFPPQILTNGLTVILIITALFLIFGVLLWRGYERALTLSIFLQGLNVIIRLMMLYPNMASKAGVWNLPLGLALLVGLVISFYLMLRLDRSDVRLTMVR